MAELFARCLLTKSSEYLLPSDPLRDLRFSQVRTSLLLPKSPRDEALIVPNEGWKRSLCDVLRIRVNVGTEPFLGIPINLIQSTY